MPTFIITDPETKTTIRMTGESAPSEQEIDLAVKQAISQKQERKVFEVDPEVMTKSPRNRREQQLQQLNRDIGAGEALAISAGRGLTTIGRAVGLADPEPEITRQAFEGLQRQRPVSTTVGEIAGESAPFLPAGVAAGAIKSITPRVLAAAGIGATEGGLIARGRGEDAQTQAETSVITGAATGAFELALPVIGRLGGALVRRVMGEAPAGAVIDNLGRPTQELQEALEKSGLTIDDLGDEAQAILAREATGREPTQAARSAFLREQGLDPLKAQVTRAADDFQLQQEAAKTSGRVRDALERQEAVLTTRFNQAVLDTGGRAETPTSTVTDALVGKATVLDQQISDLYTAARDIAPGQKNVKPILLTDKLRELAPSNRRAGGAIEAIVGDLKQKGVLDEDMKVVGRIDVETAEDVRKLMNELYDPQNTFANGLLRQLKDELDSDVFQAAGKDVFSKGRKAKASFEKDLARAGVSKFDSRKANLVRDVLENKINPDTFTNDVVFSKKWRGADLQQLKNYISTTDDGLTAFDDLRADTLAKIRDSSFIGPEDAAGNRALSRNSLEKTVNKIGPHKMRVLFSKEERKFIDDMLKVSKLREPVRGTVIGKGPSAQAIISLEKKLQDLPIIGSLVQFIDFDAQGRLVMKAKPEAIPATPSGLETTLGGRASPAAALIATEQQAEE